MNTGQKTPGKMVDRLTDREVAVREANRNLENTKFTIVKYYCPYKAGDMVKISGLLNNGRMLHVDRIALVRSKWHHYQWCWELEGRILNKQSGKVGKRIAKTLIPLEIDREITDAEEHGVPQGAGV